MDLTVLAEMIRSIFREELAALLHKKPPVDVSDKRRRAAEIRWSKERDANKTEPMQNDANASTKKMQTMQVHKGASTRKPREIKPLDARASTLHAACARVWGAYASAYTGRYGVAPVRNAKTNAQVKAFVARVRMEEAPDIAAWYVGSNVGRRVQSKHSVGLLLMDAEGIRTEWAMGRDVTQAEATQADRTLANGNVWSKLIDEARHAVR